jgi:hypothetical protein
MDFNVYGNKFREKQWRSLTRSHHAWEAEAQLWLERFTDEKTTLEEALGLLHAAFQDHDHLNPIITRFIILVANQSQPNLESELLKKKATDVLLNVFLKRKEGYRGDTLEGWAIAIRQDPELLKEFGEFLKGLHHSLLGPKQKDNVNAFIRICLHYVGDSDRVFSPEFYKAVTRNMTLLVEINYHHQCDARIWTSLRDDQHPERAQHRNAATVAALEDLVFWDTHPKDVTEAKGNLGKFLQRSQGWREPAVRELITYYARERGRLTEREATLKEACRRCQLKINELSLLRAEEGITEDDNDELDDLNRALADHIKYRESVLTQLQALPKF